MTEVRIQSTEDTDSGNLRKSTPRACRVRAERSRWNWETVASRRQAGDQKPIKLLKKEQPEKQKESKGE